jgi:NADH:ubiquinone oxidoreductase subunit 4 (subunit M)
VWLNVIGSITMLFISLIGFIHKDRQYKVFAFVTVYDIMYLLGIFSREKLILSNLGYALFGFVIIAGALEVLSGYIYALEQRRQSSATGFLCRAKRLSLLYSFITFAAIGFPISAMFTNNFLILSQLLTTNIQMGVLIMLACVIVSATLISEMFKLKDSHTECTLGKNDDLSFGYFIFMIFVIFMLLMSFIRPLWFVINE